MGSSRQPHGKGFWKGVDGTTYNGNWSRGQWHKSGIMTLPSGETYDGEWYNGRRHGHGVEVIPDEEVYEGAFKNDLRHGNGVVKYHNHDRFEGDFQRGQRWDGTLYCAKGGVIYWKDGAGPHQRGQSKTLVWPLSRIKRSCVLEAPRRKDNDRSGIPSRSLCSLSYASVLLAYEI